ncbi:DUF4148 domain-containing protein [Achromobacter arsenitoxydans]|uniref:DUF4148 domain-containing protein n=1 Tax=Achromobacter arsenitoxydans SY8 TaxID=477184 RepID=H0FFE4_9BURK|nr:DUF4148 domain-containing protein [Achromobacter arsenitoxydans]EHK63036.1 hypothetical protein KYC_27568 [Achromobacter arsenitoxydans SY8]
MKALVTPLFLSLALAGAAAHAADAHSVKSGAQVATELQEAKASGQYTFGELEYPAAQPQTTGLTNQEVQAQLQKAKANGEYTFGELEYPPATSH